jgi:hypothetical protein
MKQIVIIVHNVMVIIDLKIYVIITKLPKILKMLLTMVFFCAIS